MCETGQKCFSNWTAIRFSNPISKLLIASIFVCGSGGLNRIVSALRTPRGTEHINLAQRICSGWSCSLFRWTTQVSSSQSIFKTTHSFLFSRVLLNMHMFQDEQIKTNKARRTNQDQTQEQRIRIRTTTVTTTVTTMPTNYHPIIIIIIFIIIVIIIIIITFTTIIITIIININVANNRICWGCCCSRWLMTTSNPWHVNCSPPDKVPT